MFMNSASPSIFFAYLDSHFYSIYLPERENGGPRCLYWELKTAQRHLEVQNPKSVLPFYINYQVQGHPPWAVGADLKSAPLIVDTDPHPPKETQSKGTM